MKSINPQELNIHFMIPPPDAKRGDVIAIDTEFFGMEDGRLHRPHGQFAALGLTYDGQNVYILPDEEFIPLWMSHIDAGLHVYHNAKFDIGQLRRYCNYPDRKLLWDTMIMEQIHYAGWYDKGQLSLADLSRRYLDCYMDKTVREQFETSTELTKEQIEYLAVDVVTTWRVYQEQRKVVDENDLNVWKNIDRGALYSVLRMHGMLLDKDAWTALYEKNVAESKQIAEKYPTINLSSWQQVKKELIRLGYKNIQSTNEKALAPLLDECEFVRDVLEYRGLVKAAGTYGIGWIDEHVEADGRIYSDFFINGTDTGRFSSSKPNVENIPQKDGPHFRRAFVAQPRYVLIDADFSAQEPRIWSYLAEDTDMQQIFKDKKDIYLYFAKAGFGWDMDKSDPRRKTRMKPTVLGAIFGLTEYGLLEKDQIPLEEGKELLSAFWNKAFPQSKEYADRIRRTKDYVQTVYGRKYWLNPYRWGYENNCLNSPVQGTAADIVKIAGYRFQLEVDKAGYNKYVWLINYIHDEILVECREDLKDWTINILRRIMMETAEETHDGVPADIEIKSGMNWADAH